MTLPAGTYDARFLQGAEEVSTGQLLTDGLTGSTSLRPILTTEDFGISPSSNRTTNTTNLQNFIDHIAQHPVRGVIGAGTWNINDQLDLYDGIQLVGRGLADTQIVAPTADWLGDKATLMRLDTSNNGGNDNEKGIYLADFRLESPDKDRTDNGPLLRLQAVSNFVIERLRLDDASSYGIFVAGYGSGTFTDEVDGAAWNHTHRGTVRDCLAVRGQIGFGTEGGSENVLFERCTAVGNYTGYNSFNTSYGLHGFRTASGRNIWYSRCRAIGYRNGFLLERHRNMMLDGNFIKDCRNGISIGSYYPTDPYVSHDLRITGNYFACIEQGGIQARAIFDQYIADRVVDGVVIQGNTLHTGHMLLGKCRRLNVQFNVGSTSDGYIVTQNDATGLVANNNMSLSNSASGVVDGGNNGFIT